MTRKGDDIGRHSITFSGDAAQLQVDIAVDIRVGLGPITLYRYGLRATERWRNGVLQEVSGTTNDDGTKDFVNARRQNDRLSVEGSAGPAYLAPAASIAASHWNRAELAAPMVNIQDGALLEFKVTPKGLEQLTARGRQVAAEHYVLDGKEHLEIWYDSAGVWVGLTAIGRDGSLITYEQI
ncbi:MAG: hypothetical protein H7251_01745 [Acetobacteraceae bacterium]|nr:hypothetical protein [Acetobacteraceae bacterium]